VRNLIKEGIQSFKSVNNIFPQLIIVFRDGVSQGQREKVKLEEISAIKKALEDL
jgi:aubergine-like protein